MPLSLGSVLKQPALEYSRQANEQLLWLLKETTTTTTASAKTTTTSVVVVVLLLLLQQSEANKWMKSCRRYVCCVHVTLMQQARCASDAQCFRAVSFTLQQTSLPEQWHYAQRGSKFKHLVCLCVKRARRQHARRRRHRRRSRSGETER